MDNDRSTLSDPALLLRAVLDALPVGVWVVSSDGATLLTNRHGSNTLAVQGGTAGQRARSARTGALVLPHEWGAGRALHSGADVGEELIEIETPDGRRTTVATWATPIHDDRGQIIGAVGVTQDVSERRLADEALRRSEQARATLVRNIAGVVYRCRNDADWTVEFISEACLGITGYRVDELIGNRVASLGALMHPDDMQRVWDKCQTNLAHQRACSNEYRMLHRSGEVRWVWDQAQGVYSDSGELLYIDGLITDITERKRAEAANEKLEAQLRQSQKMESLGTLASGIAHDFNNLLGAILGNAELAELSVAADHPAHERLFELRRAAHRARDLIGQILTFGRRQVQARDVISLQDTLAESVEMLRVTLPKGIELVLRPAPGVPNVLADRTQIHQVLMNLCTNAWHAIGDRVGKIEIEIATVSLDGFQAVGNLRPGRYASISVTDNGRGMDAATAQRIFDPFFTTKAPGEGSGLGLAVVDGIVRNHDGALTVYSKPGKGSTFRLYFPAVESPAEARSVQSALGSLPRGAGEHILYLDDEEMLTVLAGQMIPFLGYRVTTFTSASDALACFEADPSAFDMLITDLNMPAMSGLDVAAKMLKVKPELPVLLASGEVSEDLRLRAAALGAHRVLFKPVGIVELADTLRAVFPGPVPFRVERDSLD